MHTLLHDFYFTYAHNSYLVNLKHVKYLNSTELILSDCCLVALQNPSYCQTFLTPF